MPGDHFSLFTGFGSTCPGPVAQDGEAWRTAASQVGARLGAEFTVFRIGPDRNRADDGVDVVDEDNTWADRAGLSPTGALLARPDGIVAWRCQKRRTGIGLSKDPRRLLGTAYLRITGQRQRHSTRSRARVEENTRAAEVTHAEADLAAIHDILPDRQT